MGWTEQPEQKPYTVIDLRSGLEHPQIQKRFEISERLLSGRRPAPIVVHAQGEGLLEQLLSTIALGDFVSLYTALLGNINPTPVNLIEQLKQELV
jgi:glucose/mannose-6-phosphate isomerase